MIRPEELIVDSFAGGGGASTGIEQALGRPVDIAINHDPDAIDMHALNHPETKHYCESVWDVDPVKACNGRPVGLAWFSPDCKHFSKAKGGTPIDKNIRGLAWVAIRWAMSVPVRVLMLENVEEFMTWGPVRPRVDGKGFEPDPHKKEATFQSFIKVLTIGLKPSDKLVREDGMIIELYSSWRDAICALGIQYDLKAKYQLFKGLGYDVKYRVSPAYDAGTPTTRNRFYLCARNDGQPVYWPQPTHGKPDSLPVKMEKLKPWKTAGDCIDWSIPCPSIFERKRPLAENTLKRIAKGIQKFVVESENPFIVPSHAAFITEHANASSQRNMAINEPLRTICAQVKGGHFGLVTAFLAKHYTGVTGTTIDKPISTITSVDHHSLVNVTLQKPSFEEWIQATKNYGGTREEYARIYNDSLVTSHMIKMRGTNIGSRTDEPVHTISSGGNHIGEVRAFLIKYYGTNTGQPLNEPLQTVTTKHRFGIVTIYGQDYQIVDIGMRMLEPHELFIAMGFPRDYIISHDSKGKKLSKAKQIARCGNAVCPPKAKAYVQANFGLIERRQVAA
ncbi:DNA cytosine methyltransferase [Vibrio sp. V37_P2S8PM304]|uniref:DNA cytosine methyltransferase n=1 Tax=Vibrio sp. V37_P2S8PM304 TaxID=1938688 RepID=UPI00137238C4|nr:DNA cytosine methyltransferase [Vibrio sp. V37_P2S8PM304]NAX32014.1 DNA cytosine methyltransferase [Vibrio sp. V37_P2S8PM304]